MPKNKVINLLPQEEFNTSIVGRILKWATGTFRIIVIITEMIVMGAFLSRFWLDAENSNLKNSIKIKAAQISEQSELEKQFRNVQLKLNIFSQISQTHNSSQMIDGVTSKLPQGVTLSEISILDGSIQIKGVAVSDSQIAQFVANLKADKSFKDINLDQISSSESNPLETGFSINISY